MIPLDYGHPDFQQFIRKELRLGDTARFASCTVFADNEIAKTCVGIVYEKDLVYILIWGRFIISGNAIILDLNFSGAPDYTIARRELIEAGFAPQSTRFVAICTNERAGTAAAKGEPEIQVVFIPY